MTWRELEEWRAWYAAEPRGEDRLDHAAALIALRFYLGPGKFKEGEELPKLRHFVALLRQSWEQLTPGEKRRRRRLLKEWQRNQVRRNFRRMVEHQEAAREAKRHGRDQHRQVERPGDD